MKPYEGRVKHGLPNGHISIADGHRGHGDGQGSANALRQSHALANIFFPRLPAYSDLEGGGASTNSQPPAYDQVIKGSSYLSQ